MMGFHVASGLVSIILQVIVDSIVLFCYLLFCSAIQTYSIMYIEDGNTLTQELNPVQVAFCDSGFSQNTPHYSCLAITNDVVHNTFHLLFIEWH